MTDKKPKKTDPLTLEETRQSCEVFFPRFRIVKEFMPPGSTTEDTLKCMENVAKLGHKLRSDKLEKDKDDRFGFLKKKDLDQLNEGLKESTISWID